MSILKKKKDGQQKTGTKRKIKKRYIVLGTVCVLGAAGFIYVQASGGEPVLPVMAQTAYIGDVESSISASGKVGSDEKQVCFAPVTSRIASVEVAVGDTVKAGDLLLSFDTAALEEAKKKADLQASQAVNGYQSMLQQSNENQNEYAEATIGLEELKVMQANQEQYVQGLTYQLEDDTAARKEELKGWLLKLQEELDYQNRRLQKKQAAGAETDKVEETITNVQNQIYEAQNELEMLDNDEMLKQKQRLIDFEKKKLEDMTEEIQRREGKESSSESGIVDGYAKQEKAASVETAKIDADAAARDLASAAAGMTAQISGIVTEVAATEGATVNEGTQLFTIESDQQVKVTVELSKYDIEQVKEGQSADVTIAGQTYAGKVSKINRMAENNAQNTPVIKADILVEDGDGSIFLGVEAKAMIHTAAKKDVVLIPYEAVNADQEGDFCYLVKDGVIVKQRITTGVESSDAVEVVEGIKEGDTVVTEINMTITEGMQVTPVIGQ